MKKEEQIEAGVVAYLKAEAAGLANVTIVGKTDDVPEEGALIYAEMEFRPIGRGELFTGFVDLGVECAAFGPDSPGDIAAATDLVNDSFPSDQSKIEALADAIAEATDGEVLAHFYHMEPTSPNPGTERRFVRTKRIKIQFEEA